MKTRSVSYALRIAATPIVVSGSLAGAADKVNIVVPQPDFWNTRFVGYDIQSGNIKRHGLDVSVIKIGGGA